MLEETRTESGRMVLNMGPQHPSTHGVLRLMLELEGENVTQCIPDMGYLHTGIEKMSEARNYHQALVLTDRIDYLAPITNNLSYIMACEKLFDVGDKVPERAQVVRVMLSELTRIASHLIWLGTHALDLGAMTMFMYCWREREQILDIMENISGVRMMTSFMRIGGLVADVPDDFAGLVADFVQVMPRKIDEYETLLSRNPIFVDRTRGVGVITRDGEKIHSSMESLIHHFKLVSEGPVPLPGEAYAAVESPRGEQATYIMSDGSNKPHRVRFRGPSFYNLQVLQHTIAGGLVADVVACIGSIDIVLGEIDR
ncbi:MAG: NADH-quinone oxidoreductase subunit D [Chloroflexi bacterium]|nr:NADH-quinone oxidoreductase subunit D [Chloroflexota bacterium]